MSKKDPYEILNVEPKATKEQIKSAYRKRARDTHPDRGGSNDAFAEVSWAYALLIDDTRRSYYNRTGNDRGPESERENNIYQNIYSLFQKLLSTHRDNIVHIDIVKQIISIFNEVNAGHEKRIQELLGVASILKDIHSRIHIKEGENIFQKMLESDIKGIELEQEKIKETMELNRESIQTLEKYKFSPVQQTSLFNILTINTSTFTITSGGWS